jgi:hypothetical protein
LRQLLEIGSRQTLATATFFAVVVAAIAPGSTLVGGMTPDRVKRLESYIDYG